MEIRESSGSFFRRPWNCFLLPHPGRRGEHKKVQRWGKRPSVQFISNQQVVTLLLFSSSSSPLPGTEGQGRAQCRNSYSKICQGFKLTRNQTGGIKLHISVVWSLSTSCTWLLSAQLAVVMSQLHPTFFGGQGKQEGKKGFLAAPLLGWTWPKFGGSCLPGARNLLLSGAPPKKHMPGWLA